MSSLKAVPELSTNRISAENSDLPHEVLEQLTKLIGKYVPGVDAVTLHVHSTSRFTLSFQLSSEVGDALTILGNILAKLEHFLPTTSTIFSII